MTYSDAATKNLINNSVSEIVLPSQWTVAGVKIKRRKLIISLVRKSLDRNI